MDGLGRGDWGYKRAGKLLCREGSSESALLAVVVLLLVA